MNSKQSSDNPPKSGRMPIYYFWLFGLCLLSVVVWKVGWREILGTLKTADVKILVAVGIIEVATLWIRALKWRLALGPGNNAVGIFFLSKAAGNWSPGRVGELSPLLIRKHRNARTGAWIVVDRFIEAGTTLAMGAAGLLALGSGSIGGIIMIVAVIVVGLVSAIFVLTRSEALRKMAERRKEGSLSQRGLAMLASVSSEIVMFKTKVPVALALTIPASAMNIAGMILLYKAFGHSVGLALMATVKCAHGLIAVIPFAPDMSGLPFAADASLLTSMADVPMEVITAAIAMYFVLVNLGLWTSFAIGVLDMRKNESE